MITTGSQIFSPFSAVANGVVYIGYEYPDGSLYALNASTGDLIWKYTTGNDVITSPAVANGVVYVGSEDNHVYALNASTGALLWKYATSGYYPFFSGSGQWGGVLRDLGDYNAVRVERQHGSPPVEVHDWG